MENGTCIQSSLWFTESGPLKTYPVSGSSRGENAVLMAKIRGGCFVVIERKQ